MCLVSDCSRALDTPAGIYRLGHHETGETFENTGTVGVLPGTSTLASSIFALEQRRRRIRDTDAGLAEVIRMASLTPAERTGFANDGGSLETGKLADVLVLSRDLVVQRTFIAGMEFLVSAGAATLPRRQRRVADRARCVLSLATTSANSSMRFVVFLLADSVFGTYRGTGAVNR